MHYPIIILDPSKLKKVFSVNLLLLNQDNFLIRFLFRFSFFFVFFVFCKFKDNLLLLKQDHFLTRFSKYQQVIFDHNSKYPSVLSFVVLLFRFLF